MAVSPIARLAAPLARRRTSIDRRYTPCDVAETLYRRRGIDTDQRLKMPDDGPIDSSEGGRALSELF
ncbi:MAG: hypothetical protein IT428_21815 [Planctomycetaceae bacterium]|nr:hypothetical protein [Planctomycetaceae bacterium]